MAPKFITKKIKSIDKAIKDRYTNELEYRFIEEYIDLVMEEYDDELIGTVTDRRSRTNPVIYREEFKTQLQNFEYISERSNSTTISLPEINTFPWGVGRLRIIENILEGIIGNYIEVDGDQYVAMYEKKPSLEPYDKTITSKQRIYLLKWNTTVNRRWQEVFPKESPTWYPFSNSPSIDIFFAPNKEIEERITNWLPRFIHKISKEMSK